MTFSSLFCRIARGRAAFWGAAIAAVLVTLLTSGCNVSPPAQAENPQPVTVRQPNRFDRPLEIHASGNVEAAETANLAFQVSGMVSKVHVEEGQMVRAGQLLAELDPRDYEDRVTATASQAEAAKANLQKTEAGVRRQELAQAKVDLDRTEDEYNRLRALYERGSLAPNDYKKIEAAWQAARERYSLAQEGARAEDKLAAKDAFRAAEAQEAMAKKALSDTRLVAPFAGVVVKRQIESGDLASPTRVAMVVMNLHPVKVRVGVPEAEIGQVRTGQSSTVEIPSLGHRRFTGRVETVGYAADPAARTFDVKISVPNPKMELRAGMIAESLIETGAKISALTVPGQAIVRDANGVSLVMVLFPEKHRVYARRVETGTVYGREVEVRQGLAGSEKIVVAGQQLVQDGSLVTVSEDEERAAP